MASKKPITSMTPKGSWILKLLVLVLIAFVLASVLYPKQLWTRQDQLTEEARERMRNVNYMVQRYHDTHQRYTENLDTLVQFMQNDSILVKRPSFEVETLTFFDSKYDSFLVGFMDRFHISKLEMNRVSSDSIVLSLIPKEMFADVMPPSQLAMGSEDSIKAEWRGKGDEDIYWNIWSRGKIQIHEIPYDTLIVPSTEYLLTLPLAEITTDPISGESFVTNLNARLKLMGEVEYNVVRRGEPENPLEGELMVNLLINKLARLARGKLDEAMKQDTTLFERQLELQSDYFMNELGMMTPGKEVLIEAETERTLPVDSVSQYDDPAVIKDLLFHTTYDSLIRMWTEWPETQEMLAKVNVSEQYMVSSVDTVGVTIEPPFGKEFDLPPRGFLEKVFHVGPIDNPGFVENDDLSWSEKE